VDDPLEASVTGLATAEAPLRRSAEFFRMLIGLYTQPEQPRLRVPCAALRTHLMDEVEVELRQVLGRLPAYSWFLRASFAAQSSARSTASRSRAWWRSSRLQPVPRPQVLLLSLVVTAYVTAGQERRSRARGDAQPPP